MPIEIGGSGAKSTIEHSGKSTMTSKVQGRVEHIWLDAFPVLLPLSDLPGGRSDCAEREKVLKHIWQALCRLPGRKQSRAGKTSDIFSWKVKGLGTVWPRARRSCAFLSLWAAFLKMPRLQRKRRDRSVDGAAFIRTDAAGRFGTGKTDFQPLTKTAGTL